MATLTVQKTNTSVDVDDAVKPEVTTRDYSGAQEKTDPKEIALVRKLDLWIMPVLWLMYWLNYLVRASLTRWLAWANAKDRTATPLLSPASTHLKRT